MRKNMKNGCLKPVSKLPRRHRDCTHHVLLPAPEEGVDAVLGPGQEAHAEAEQGVGVGGLALRETLQDQDQEREEDDRAAHLEEVRNATVVAATLTSTGLVINSFADLASGVPQLLTK